MTISIRIASINSGPYKYKARVLSVQPKLSLIKEELPYCLFPYRTKAKRFSIIKGTSHGITLTWVNFQFTHTFHGRNLWHTYVNFACSSRITATTTKPFYTKYIGLSFIMFFKTVLSKYFFCSCWRLFTFMVGRLKRKQDKIEFLKWMLI